VVTDFFQEMGLQLSHHSIDEVGAKARKPQKNSTLHKASRLIGAEAEKKDVGNHGGPGCSGLIVQVLQADGGKRL
jgi:hypothetical protein